jgi:hypothetical protein
MLPVTSLTDSTKCVTTNYARAQRELVGATMKILAGTELPLRVLRQGHRIGDLLGCRRVQHGLVHQ